MSSSMGRAAALAVLLLAGLGNASGPSASLYAYVPDVLVVRSGDDADSVLDELEVTFGVQASDDPASADRPDLKRLDRTARVMERHWIALDARCDANAVFALMYLTTTYGVRYHIQNDYFDDNDYLSIITVSFAKLYLDAYDHWASGDSAAAPLPWAEAFDHASSGQSSILEDEFLGMNAHINYDLAVAIASLGPYGPDGTSRKPDMDRINHVLAAVTDDVGYEIAKHYGPTPPTSEPDRGSGANVTPETMVVLEGIYAWRENAWNNALLIDAAPTSDARAFHDATMQQNSWAIAQGFQSPKLVSPSAERLAYCQANP